MPKHPKEDIDTWFSYNYSPERRTIYIGSITPETQGSDGESGTDCKMAEFFIKAITHLSFLSRDPIIIHMNNVGGDWYHGMAIYDAIRASRSHVYGVCWGQAMSMGSIIIQACDSRIAAEHCTFMIHDGSENLVGSCKSVEAWAKYACKTRKLMYQIYLDRMGKTNPSLTIGKIEKICSHDKIFTAEEAVLKGLADWILGDLNDPYMYYATKTQNTKWTTDAVNTENRRKQ